MTTSLTAAVTHEDSLRALGWYLDREQLRDIRLTMRDGQFELFAQGADNEEARHLQLTTTNIMELRSEASRRRGTGVPGAFAGRPSRLKALRDRRVSQAPLSRWLDEARTLPYQDLLRVIGFDLDRAGAIGFRIDEQESSFVLRVASSARLPDVNEVYELSRESLRARVAQAVRRRGFRRAAVA